MGTVSELKKEKTINPVNNVLLAEHEMRDFVVYALHGTSVEDILETGYWAHVAERFVPFKTQIKVIAEDGSWIAELIVTACDRNWARVYMMHFHDLSEQEAAPSKDSNFTVNFAPAHGWRIIQKDTKEVIQKGFNTKDDAHKALKDYENTIKG